MKVPKRCQLDKKFVQREKSVQRLPDASKGNQLPSQDLNHRNCCNSMMKRRRKVVQYWNLGRITKAASGGLASDQIFGSKKGKEK